LLDLERVVHGEIQHQKPLVFPGDQIALDGAVPRRNGGGVEGEVKFGALLA
jgi:hypothetical protein